MQAVPPTSFPWLSILREPAVLILAITVLFRLVLVPAILRLVRADLKPELDTVDKLRLEVPAVKAQVDVHANALERLADVPEGIARIEEQLRTLLKDRRHGQ